MVVKLSSVLCFSGAHPSLEPLPDVVELLSLSLSPTAMQEELAPHHAIRLHESFSQDYFMVWFFHVCCLTDLLHGMVLPCVLPGRITFWSGSSSTVLPDRLAQPGVVLPCVLS